MLLKTLRHRSVAIAFTAAAVALTGISAVGVTATVATSQAEAQEIRFGQPTLYTRDIDAMVTFYSALGFVEVFRFPPTDTQFVTMRKGTFYISMVTYRAIRQATGIRNIGPADNFQMDVAILVTDVDTTYQQAVAAGGRPKREPTDQPFGERQAYVVDPSGNLVQISTHHE